MAGKTAYYHLPGLFEFYELYRLFLPLFREHREYFYDWCEIGSIYGAPADCLWGGGRVGCGDADPREVLALAEAWNVSPRLTFSNSLLRREHLDDSRCRRLCRLFAEGRIPCGVIVHSDLLLRYLREAYPSLYFVSSTTKVLTSPAEFKSELERPEFRYVVPDFRLNRLLSEPGVLTDGQKAKTELLCNECCDVGCTRRRDCYEAVSRMNLGEDCPPYRCASPAGREGYRFSRAMESPAFIGTELITETYLPRGFSQFKIEGRSLGSAMVLEFLLYYMTKPECALRVREAIYLDGMLDLF